MSSSETAAPSTSCRHQFQMALGGALAASLVDWFAPTIFAGHSLVLGIVFYWLVLVRCGPRPALLPLLAITATLWVKWSQPYSAALIALEGLAVSWAWRRRYSPVLADLIYWAAFGTPASWFFYSRIYPLPHPVFDYALIVQVANGLIAVLLALLFAGLLPETQKYIRANGAETLKQFVLKRCAIFGTVPILVAALVTGRYFEAGSIEQANQNSVAVAGKIASELARSVTAAQHAVIAVGTRFATASEFNQASRLSEILERERVANPSFITLLAADANGIIHARALPAPRAPSGVTSVADRDYFIQPMATGRPYVSDVFKGRGFGTDILIAVSAPVVTLEGTRLGVIEGSIPTRNFETVLAQNLAGGRAVITDHNRNVIAATGWSLAPLDNLEDSRLGQLIAKSTGKPGRFTDDKGARRESYTSITVPVPGTQWALTVQRPWAEVMHPIATVYLIASLVALIVVTLAALFITRSLGGLLAATSALENFTRAPDQYAAELKQLAASEEDVPGEVRDLMTHMARMAAQLRLEAAQREQFVSELETRVSQRTQELESALVAAQSADRAKSTFLATVSHELRTPLTAIITGTALLKRAPGPRPENEIRILTALEKSGHALQHVISGVLDYSKITAGAVEISYQPFSPATLVRDVVDVLSMNARQSGLTLIGDTTCEPEVTWIGDAPHLRQVLLNLVGNAIKFTPRGTITVMAGIIEATHNLPRRLHFAVIDTGPGIPAEQQRAIFEPFVQLETTQTAINAGTGLGLAISQKLVAAMGGKISLESTPGKGSTFQFWVPEKPAGKSHSSTGAGDPADTL